MDRRHLECFLAVVDHHGFTSAARALHIAQPSLSQTIKSLERELGVDLFARLSHGVRLTSAGEALIGPARRTVRDFALARGAVESVSTLEGGLLDIVALPSLAVDPTADLIARFHRRHPQVKIRLAAPGTRDIFQPLRLGDSEIGVAIQPIQPGPLTVIEFEFEPFYLGLPPDSPLAQDSVFPTSELGGLDLIAAITTRPLLSRILVEAGVEPNFTVESGHREAIVPLVLGGVGAAFFTPAVAQDARLRGAVICRLDPPIGRRVAVMFRADSLSPAARAFLDLLGGPAPRTVSYAGPGEEIKQLQPAP